MEPHVVETVLLAFLKDTQPLVDIRRRIAGFGETAVLHRAAQVERSSVEHQPTVLNTDVTQAESHIHRHAFIVDGVLIKPGMELIPKHHVLRQRQIVAVVVDDNLYFPGIQMRDYPFTPDDGSCLQFDTPHHTVPVALRLVGNAVGVLSHTDIFNAIIDTHSNFVPLSATDVSRHIVAMRYRQRHVMPHLVAIDIDGGLDMRPLDEQRDAAMVPIFGNVYRTLIPCRPDVMALGSQEERELHRTLLTVALHVRVEIIRRVVERPRPLGTGGDDVALAVGEHRARQHDIIMKDSAVAEGEVPRASQRERLLGMSGTPTDNHQHTGKETFVH